MESPWSDGPRLWMIVEDIFHIAGRGTVITGRLEGEGQLKLGDVVVCEGMRWIVNAIERFRATLSTVEPGVNIGILLGKGPSGDVLRGRTVQFETSDGPQMGPQMGLQDSAATPAKKRWRR